MQAKVKWFWGALFTIEVALTLLTYQPGTFSFLLKRGELESVQSPTVALLARLQESRAIPRAIQTPLRGQISPTSIRARLYYITKTKLTSPKASLPLWNGARSVLTLRSIITSVRLGPRDSKLSSVLRAELLLRAPSGGTSYLSGAWKVKSYSEEEKEVAVTPPRLLSSEDDILAIAQLVYTLTELPSVSFVRIVEKRSCRPTAQICHELRTLTSVPLSRKSFPPEFFIGKAHSPALSSNAPAIPLIP